MSYRAYDTLVLVMITLIGGLLVLVGFLARWPGFVEELWWAVLGLGIFLILVSLVSIGFVATQPTKIRCP